MTKIDTKNNFCFAVNSKNASLADFFVLIKPGVLFLVVYTAIITLCISPITLNFWGNFYLILSIAMGSAGAATFNMWYDKDIDIIMDRTRKRPIPLKKIAPRDALILSFSLSVGSIILIIYHTNLLAGGLLLLSIFYYSIIYTICLKRRTTYNIVIGGVAGAFPPVIAWVGGGNTIFTPLPWILFMIIFLWTPSHFWALSIHSRKDYQKANIPMLPVIDGVNNTKIQIVIYSILLFSMSIFLAIYQGINSWFPTFYLISAIILGIIYITLAFLLLFSQKISYGIRLFTYSIFYLFLLFSALVIGNIFH